MKIGAPVQPVPPANSSGSPFTPVEFEGLSALPYIDDSASFGRIVWSFKAEGIRPPATPPRPRPAPESSNPKVA